MHMGELAEQVKIEVPEGMSEEHLDFLDLLRDLGDTNMFGAGPYIMAEFDIPKSQASNYLQFWMKTF